MNPSLSIIVPIYFVEKYICECLDSILFQSYQDFELILVDDGSPDACGGICDLYAKKDKRIRVVHKENGGLSSARNAGLDIACGTYISFIDSDDFISNDYYQKNMEYLLSHPQVDLLVMQVCRYDNCNNRVVYNKERELKTQTDIVNYMMSMEYIGAAWINIYKKSIFDELRYPVGKIFEDGYVLSDIIKKVKIVYISITGIYYYRTRYDSIMGKRKTIKDWYDILNTHIKQLDYCYCIPDNNKLFLNKYGICSLALIYAVLEYPDENFDKYIKKFESYNYNWIQLLSLNLSFRKKIRLFILKIIGFSFVVKVYKFLRLYKNC